MMMDEKSANNPQADSAPILIKKYPNRRLYNTATSSYIVLDDIVDLVKAGTEFVIEDTKTGEDLTRSILNQVIYEREAGKTDFHFPLDVQKQLILMYDDAYGKMVPDYLRESMNVFVSERDKITAAFEEVVSNNSKAMTSFGEQMAQRNIDMFNQSFDFFRSMSGMAMPSANRKKNVDTDDKADDKEQQLKDIQDQIDALQAKLKSINS